MFWEFVLRLFVAGILGAIIGLEQRKPDLGHIFLFLWAVPLL